MSAVLLVAAAVISLNGDAWRLDGEPVSVPHTWNADDYDKGFADGLGAADFRRNVDSGNSVGLRPGENEIVLLQEVAAGEEVVDGDVF